MNKLKPKYKINDFLYYYDSKSKRIRGFTVDEIRINRVSTTYIQDVQTYAPYTEVDEKYVAKTPELVAKKILGKDFCYTKVVEILKDDSDKKDK